ncbi:MAG: hypothetical protein WBD22_12295, partial [Pyrinomonadaceae bacterium]
GMKYYRNVQVASDATENRKEKDEYDDYTPDNLRGGLDFTLPPADVPGVNTDAGYDEAKETLDEISLEESEVFDEAMKTEGVIETIDDDGDDL